ncbi:hypothetical protein AB0H43_12860 [Hamadaea sp. NPDC050747]|uniref:hypothetical protein n=1 Tax=Hamadaea sp. NPDC050747 TaxID=3155789 RepID=UPI0033F9587A
MHSIVSDWSTFAATVVALLVLAWSRRDVAKQRTEAAQARKDAAEAKLETERTRLHTFESGILRELLDSLPERPPTTTPRLLLSPHQYGLVAMLSPNALPFWRDIVALVAESESKRAEFARYVGRSADGAALVNPALTELWNKHGVAARGSADETILWLLRRDVLRALAQRNGRTSADIDLWLAELYPL